MYSTVSSILRGSGRMIQRATTTTGSVPLSKSLLRTLLKRVSASERKVASFLAGTRYQSGHLAEFCRKCSLCFRSTAVSWSRNPACSIKEVARDSCSSTRLGTHRYSGDDSQSGCGTQANTYSDRTHSQGASSDPGEGSLAASERQTVLRSGGPASTRCSGYPRGSSLPTEIRWRGKQLQSYRGTLFYRRANNVVSLSGTLARSFERCPWPRHRGSAGSFAPAWVFVSPVARPNSSSSAPPNVSGAAFADPGP